MPKQINLPSTSGPRAQKFENTRYSLLDVTAAGTYKFFSLPVGGSVTEFDTNMTDAGVVANGTHLTVYSVGVRLWNKNATAPGIEWWHDAISTLFGNAKMVISTVGKQDMGEWHMSELMPTLFGVSNDTDASPQLTRATNIVAPANIEAWRHYRRVPVVLSEQTRFSFDLKTAAAMPSDARVACILKVVEVRRY